MQNGHTFGILLHIKLILFYPFNCITWEQCFNVSVSRHFGPFDGFNGVNITLPVFPFQIFLVHDEIQIHSQQEIGYSFNFTDCNFKFDMRSEAIKMIFEKIVLFPTRKYGSIFLLFQVKTLSRYTKEQSTSITAARNSQTRKYKCMTHQDF